MKKINPNLIILAGSIIGVLSFFLPWVKVKSSWISYSYSFSGFSLINEFNVSILILVIVAFFLTAGFSIFSIIKEQMMKIVSVIMIVLGAFALIGVIGALISISNTSNNNLVQLVGEINKQFGIVLSLISALAIIAAGILSTLGIPDTGPDALKNLKADIFNSAKTFWQENSNFPQTRAGSDYQYSTGQQRQPYLQQQGWNQNQQPYQQTQHSQWQSNQQQTWGQPQPQDQYPQWQANQQQNWNPPSQPQQYQQPSQPDQTWQSNQQLGWGQQSTQPAQFQQTNPYVQPWQSGQQQSQEPPAWQKRTQKPPAWLTNNQSPQSQTNPNPEDPEQTG